MRILGLDPSVRNFGVSLIDDVGKLIYREVHQPQETHPNWWLVQNIKSWLEYLIREKNPGYVSIEYPLVHSSHGALIYAVYCSLVEMMTVKHVVWKAFFPQSMRIFTGDKNSTQLYRLERDKLTIECPDEKKISIHEFDAYLYAKLFQSYLNGNVKLIKSYAKYDCDLEYSNLGFYKGVV